MVHPECPKPGPGCIPGKCFPGFRYISKDRRFGKGSRAADVVHLHNDTKNTVERTVGGLFSKMPSRFLQIKGMSMLAESSGGLYGAPRHGKWQHPGQEVERDRRLLSTGRQVNVPKVQSWQGHHDLGRIEGVSGHLRLQNDRVEAGWKMRLQDGPAENGPERHKASQRGRKGVRATRKNHQVPGNGAVRWVGNGLAYLVSDRFQTSAVRPVSDQCQTSVRPVSD